jgi:hypothetical protein
MEFLDVVVETTVEIALSGPQILGNIFFAGQCNFSLCVLPSGDETIAIRSGRKGVVRLGSRTVATE